MMKLSSKSDYGIRALVDLAQLEGAGPIPSSEIAVRQGIPASLVGQVLGRLRTAGFIRSTRGAQGGHQLALPPAAIRLDEVVQALEGPIVPGACLDDAPIERCTGAAAQVPPLGGRARGHSGGAQRPHRRRPRPAARCERRPLPHLTIRAF